MPPGSMAIYRNVADNTGYDVTTWTDMGWDTTVYEDRNVFLPASPKGVEVLEDGHYLILYNEGFEISGTLDRCTFQTRLTVNGTYEPGTYGHGYIRGSEGCNECFPYNVSIVELSAEDVIVVQCQQQAGTTPSPTRMTGVGGIQLLKLDDDCDYCRINAFRTGRVLDIGDTLTWYVSTEVDSGSFTVSNADITLEQAGWYLGTLSLGWANNSSPATRSICISALNNTTAASDVRNSLSSSYVRATSGTLGATNAVFLFYADEDDVMNLNTSGGGGGGTFNFGDDCYLSLVKLPDTINKIDLYDATGAQSFDVTETPFTWDSENEEDSAFDHSTSSSTDDVTIVKPGPFMFLGNFYGSRASGTNRYQTIARMRREGTALTFGCFGDYNRQASSVPVHAGSHGALFPWLSVDEVIDMSREDTSTSSGTAPLTVAEYMGLQGIYLPSIFPTFWRNGGFFLQRG